MVFARGKMGTDTISTDKNTIPDVVKRIHFIAVCGTGMGALACMVKELGFDVTGSDEKIYPPMSDFLASKGIPISSGFDGRNLSDEPDLVVVGNAVPRTNPEVQQMFQMGLHYCSMPQAINRFIGAGKKQILVTGTHGKTTASSLLTWILHEAGWDPTFFIGGILQNFDSNYRLGNGDVMVIEGDEYDTAFFDKGAKFLHYDPFMTILIRVEFDHADIFRDLQHTCQVFDGFLSGLSTESALFAYDNDDNITALVRDLQCEVISYGREAQSGWRLGDVSIAPPQTVFDVFKGDTLFGTFSIPMMGEHNLLNTLSAIAVADKLGIPVESIADALQRFKGIKRRQEIRGEKRGIIVMDDFAHHPTAVHETIRAVKSFYPDRRLVAVFEPRTNSSMRKVFQNVYPHSFQHADLICIREPSFPEKIPSEERFSSEQLVADLKDGGKTAHCFPDTDSIIDFLAGSATSGDLILVMSSGGFDNIHERLLAAL